MADSQIPLRLPLVPVPTRDDLIASGMSSEGADQIIKVINGLNASLSGVDTLVDGAITGKAALTAENQQLQNQLADSLVIFIYKYRLLDDDGNERFVITTMNGYTEKEALNKLKALFPDYAVYELVEKFTTSPDGKYYTPG